ncbi:MAG: GDP-mannose 4,6-dehydratase [Candidatus Micrarchaeota archaeon]|nr:GDP-mannose 4,6-dehydratase [Candidatus Micrarchaeota archaeon]
MEKKFWFQKSVLVTGGSGLLGSWLVDMLIEKGATVTVMMRDKVPSSRLYEIDGWKKTNVARGELENYYDIERTINEYEIDTVFHLGAQTIVGTANRSPISTFKANIEGTWNVLEACRNAKLVKKIVIASSDKAYGDQEKLPYDENTPLQGRHPYDVSKSCADLIAQSYHHTYAMPICIARCGNIYGPGDLNFNRIVPGTIRSIVTGERPQIRSDGTYVRDYIYVKDVVDAYVTLTENMERKEIIGEAFNFSTKNKITVLELVKIVLKEMKSKLEPVILSEANAEIKKQYLSSEKAKKLLGWEAKYTIEHGLRETIPWYLNYIKNERTA